MLRCEICVVNFAAMSSTPQHDTLLDAAASGARAVRCLTEAGEVCSHAWKVDVESCCESLVFCVGPVNLSNVCSNTATAHTAALDCCQPSPPSTPPIKDVHLHPSGMKHAQHLQYALDPGLGTETQSAATLRTSEKVHVWRVTYLEEGRKLKDYRALDRQLLCSCPDCGLCKP